MASGSTPSDHVEKQLQIRLLTSQSDYAVPNTTLSIPGSIDADGLNKLVLGLLAENDREHEGLKFDFIVFDEFVRTSLDEILEAKGEVNRENVFDVHYIEGSKAPTPKTSVNHDDWISGVSASCDYILTACYDNTVNIFTAEGEKKLVIPGHAGPVKDVAWIDAEQGIFVSSSHDQTLMLYKWNIDTNSVESVNACKGHERSVDCVGVAPDRSLVASGSFDTQLKIWSAKIETEGPADGDGDKRAKVGEGRALTRTPMMTLAGHKEGISGVTWLDSQDSLCTSSWDHTLKIWDLEMGGMKSEMVGNKSFFDLSYSPLNRTLLTAAADRTIRLYDPRSNEGSIIKATYLSHSGWVTCVDWCKTKETLFISGSHDNLVKMWDSRSYKTPLFDMSGHVDRVLCCDWSQAEYVVSGGSDNNMKIFKSNL